MIFFKKIMKNPVLTISSFFLFLFVLLPIFFNYVIPISINTTPSLPEGFYAQSRIDQDDDFKRGDTIVFDARECCFIYDPGIHMVNLLMKKVYGVPGDRIYFDKEDPQKLYIENKEGGIVAEMSLLKVSKSGRNLPRIKEGVIQGGQYFMSTPHKRSLDSRYFGLVDKKYFLSRSELIFSF